MPLLIKACASLAEAHDAGLVHRDIKPANAFVCRAADELDVVKVLDFGLVRTLEGQPFHADAVRFADEWERVAYDRTYPSLPLGEFEPLVHERFTLLASDLYTTHGDCVRE